MTFGSNYIVWEDGKLSGDKTLVEKLKKELGKLEGEWVGYSFISYTDTDHLNTPLSVYIVAKELFGEFEFEGDKIPVPEGPKNANVVF